MRRLNYLMILCLISFVCNAVAGDQTDSSPATDRRIVESPEEMFRWWQGQVFEPEVYWRTFAFKKSEWSATNHATVSPEDNDWVKVDGIDHESTVQWDMLIGYPYSRAIRIEFDIDGPSQEKLDVLQLSEFRVCTKLPGKDADFDRVPIAMVVANSALDHEAATIDDNQKTGWPISGKHPVISFEFAEPIRRKESSVIIRMETTLRKSASEVKAVRMRLSSTFHIDPHRLEPLPDELKTIIFDQGMNARSKTEVDRVQDFFETHIIPASRFKKWKARFQK